MMPTWSFPKPSEVCRSAALVRQSSLTKPPGSLGALEDVAVQLAAWQGRDRPRSRPAHALLFASDHPVARHGVSAYPQAVTAAMVANFVSGGAASSVASRALGVPLRVVDVGVLSAVQSGGPVELVRDPVADLPAGDLRTEDAMSEETYAAALAAGRRQVDLLPDDAALLILGEMGIGNSTAAAALAASLLGIPAREAVGPGTGVRGAALERKIQVVADAVARVGKVSPHRAMQALGGRDLAAMMGAAACALERRMAVLVDGFIVTASLLPLVALHPEVRAGLLFAHRSAEPGHQRLLAALEARPLLDLGLRLGEGSGALTALPLVDLACDLHSGMASFEEAKVPGPSEPR